MVPVLGRFVAVGALGLVVQIAILAVLTAVLHWSWITSTIVAVECAIVHNFVWHTRFTWSSRRQVSRSDGCAERFVRFNFASAITSIAGNVLLMTVFVELMRLPVVTANILAVAIAGAANFGLADRWVFRALPILAVVLLNASSASAAPSAQTLQAWDKFVVQTEARLERDRSSPCAIGSSIMASGGSIDVGDGTITSWCGSALIRNVTVTQLLERLQNPGTPPPQEDVSASRVLSRGTDALRVYIRLVRHAIITVSYDSEHEMTFRRWSPTLATARSVATRLDEVGGGDHGYLWRLHSYWRYQQLDGGVAVTLESITLSRDVPLLVKPVVDRIGSRVARESVIRTLEALKRYLETPS
jgi:putative flippase GtrA